MSSTQPVSSSSTTTSYLSYLNPLKAASGAYTLASSILGWNTPAAMPNSIEKDCKELPAQKADIEIESATDDFFQVKRNMTKDKALEIIEKDPNSFLDLPQKFQNSGKFVQMAVASNPSIIPILKEEFQTNDAVLISAAKHSEGFNFLPAEKLADPSFLSKLIKAIKSDIDHNKHADLSEEDKLIPIKALGKAEAASNKLDEDQKLKLFLELGAAFATIAPPELLKNRSYVLEMVKQNGSVYNKADKQMQKDPEILVAASRTFSIDSMQIPSELLEDKELLIDLVKNVPGLFRQVPPHLKNDEDFVLILLNQFKGKTYEDSQNFDLILSSCSCKSDAFMMKAIDIRGSAYNFCTNQQKNNEDFVLAAFKKFRPALDQFNKSSNISKEFALKTTTIDGYHAYRSLTQFRGDIDFAKAALDSVKKTKIPLDVLTHMFPDSIKSMLA